LARHRDFPADEQLRDGLVQRFEFTYEIAHRTLKRFLESRAATPGTIDAMSFPDLIRTASEQGLVAGGWTAWRLFREMRSRTSHSYDERVAVEVVRGIPAFLEEARSLHRALAAAGS
jgi:nucleotidyltransferase substrate binding protein (TIGR01987 family)